MEGMIVNKIAQSGLETIDLEEFFEKGTVVGFDLKPFLFMEMIIKEKDFRAALAEHEWTAYQHKIVAVHCSADAIIPQWAYMLVASYLTPVANDIIYGDERSAIEMIILKKIEEIDIAAYVDRRIIIKGCGDLNIGAGPYLSITKKLFPVAKSIMYGEACSTVPVYKKK